MQELVRGPLEEDERRFVQKVRANERPVAVDAKWNVNSAAYFHNQILAEVQFASSIKGHKRTRPCIPFLEAILPLRLHDTSAPRAP